MIFVQDTNEDENVPAPAVTNDSDSIKLEIDENGVINLHKHVASEDKVNVKEPTCTEEGLHRRHRLRGLRRGHRAGRDDPRNRP